ncbi:MAG: stage III sporulation protein AA [Firmicutes bacterium]|nr:stage III sporulation protein AA [Bacillota bacterium]
MPNLKNFLPYTAADAIPDDVFDTALEIRMRSGQNLAVRCPDNCLETDIPVTPQLLSETLQNICGYSLYAYANDIARGFVTFEGARVGIGGQVIFSDGESRGIRTVSSLNIRAAREIKGCADDIYDSIKSGNKVYNTIIASPPLCGKTTLLRDIARRLGNDGINVSLIDERDELASLDSTGTPRLDVGRCTDVLSGCDKHTGIMMALRSLAPQVIILDEIGESADIPAINRALTGGVSVICTAHADSLKTLKAKKYIRPLFADKLFERLIILNGIGSREITELDEKC